MKFSAFGEENLWRGAKGNSQRTLPAPAHQAGAGPSLLLPDAV